MARTKQIERRADASKPRKQGLRRSELQTKKDKAAKGERKKRRTHPGVAAKREIRRLQTGKDKLKLCTQRAPIARLMREQVSEQAANGEMHIQAKAIDAYREVLETTITSLFDCAGEFTRLKNQVTVMLPAFKLAVKHKLGEDVYQKCYPADAAIGMLAPVVRRQEKKQAKNGVKKVKKSAVQSSAVVVVSTGGDEDATDAMHEEEEATSS
jgi:histone H3/H4